MISVSRQTQAKSAQYVQPMWDHFPFTLKQAGHEPVPARGSKDFSFSRCENEESAAVQAVGLHFINSLICTVYNIHIFINCMHTSQTETLNLLTVFVQRRIPKL